MRAVRKDVPIEPVYENAAIVLNNIFFDVDKFELRPESYPELERVIAFLLQNPTLKIEISGHTDKTGSEPYYQQLSEKRAKSAVDFLNTKAISKNRV